MTRIANNPESTAAALRRTAAVAAMLFLSACGGSKSGSSGSYTISGTISGLNTGSVVLANGSSTVTVAAGATTWSFSGTFTGGSSYSVTVETQPASELCDVVSGGSGATLQSNVSDVIVACSTYGQWTWEAGLETVDGSGVYGIRGAASANNQPGARSGSSSWSDASGDLWLFGGTGYDSTGRPGALNDLWVYSPSAGQWTWKSGLDSINGAGVYGTLGTAAAGNGPGARYSASAWTDASGHFWLFGGHGNDATGAVGNLNDLWTYDPVAGQWTWISGSNAAGASGVYGTLGTAAAGNVPGARYGAQAWRDAAGNLWLFGGFGEDSTGHAGKLNDLWQFNPGTGQWTWISGALTAEAGGSYGTQGAAAASNVPGARQNATGWVDASGDLWLLGGYGYDGAGSVGYLNDLWQFSPTSGLWTWISGASRGGAAGTYGTQGTTTAGSLPGARQSASNWVDASGIVWLFGGYGYDSAGSLGALNDLWHYDPSSKQWTWISGADVANALGVYGSQGSLAGSAAPGGRQLATAWVDVSGHRWLFGGAGNASTGSGYLNDLWQFVPP